MGIINAIPMMEVSILCIDDHFESNQDEIEKWVDFSAVTRAAVSSAFKQDSEIVL